MEINYFLEKIKKFTYDQEEYIELFEAIIESIPDVEIQIMTINSKLAKHEFIKYDNKNYIIWDMNYWKIFEKYLFINYYLYNLQIRKTNPSSCLILTTSLFLNFLANKFEHFTELSSSYSKDCLLLDYNLPEINEKNPFFQMIKRDLLIAKLYTLFHELGHLYFEMNPEYANENKTAIKQGLGLLKDDIDFFLGEWSRFYPKLVKQDYLIMIDKVLDNIAYSYFIEELAIDVTALINVIDFYNENYDIKIENYIPNILSTTFLLGAFNINIDSFSKSIERYAPIFYMDEKNIHKRLENANKENSISNAKVFWRGSLKYGIERIQLLKKYNYIDNISSDSLQIINNHDEIISPHIEKFSKEYVSSYAIFKRMLSYYQYKT